MYRIILLCTFLFASGQGSQDKKQFTDYESLIQQSMDDMPPGSIDFICDALCQDDESSGTDAAVLEALSYLQSEISSLHAKLNSISESVDSNGGSGVQLRPEWEKKYPIYMVESPYGHYQLTKSEAARMCEESGGKLATYIQLLAAFDAGMDWCSCGWLEDGFAAYPIQWPRDGCHKQVGPGVRANCTWQRTWNGWCIKDEV